MTNQEIALEYMQRFCAGEIEGLEPLLANSLTFTGTLHCFGSANEYLASLRSDPPEKCEYRILSITENTDSVALFYEYIKPKGVMQIAQLFKISGQQIIEILLVFDSQALT